MVSKLVLKFVNNYAKKVNNITKGAMFDNIKHNIRPQNVVPLAQDTLMLPKNQLYKMLSDLGVSENKIKILSLCDDPSVILEELRTFNSNKNAINNYIKQRILEYTKLCDTFGRKLNLGGTNQKHLAIFKDDASIDIMDLSTKHRAMKMFSAGKLKVKQLPEEMILSPEDIKIKKIVDDKFKEISGTNFDMVQYRGERLGQHMPHLQTLKGLKQGDVFEAPGYAWTTNDRFYAFNNYADVGDSLGFTLVKYHILCPRGTKLLASRSRLGQEYVLPCDSKFKLIKKLVNKKDGSIEIFCEHLPVSIN